MSNSATSRPPRRFCDIVMKGGITSGLVYPRAISELTRTFRLKSVGGTSAGAIAAAAAAAAESGRIRSGNAESFAQVGRLPALLSSRNESGYTNLFTFFQPQESTSRLFRVLAAALNASKPAAVGRALRAAILEYWLPCVLGALPGLVLLLLAINHPLAALSVVSFLIGLVVAVTGGVAAVAVAFLREFGRAVPENFYGLCSGMDGEVFPARSKAGDRAAVAATPTGKAIPLTSWLTDFLNDAAGLSKQSEPLTFGQLWNPNLPLGQQPAETDGEVRLEMMTTCLSWGRPFRLPFRSDEDLKENIFYFRESEFRQLFPTNVVDWLCAHGRNSSLREQWRKEGFRPMPDPWNLPVVVATRMSLSFPILLSAVPLYAYDREADRDANPPRPCWFSDGGICSNFPMHFFDSPIPRWPTLGISLFTVPDSTPDAEMAQGWMPGDNNQFQREAWNDFPARGGLASVFGFVGAIIGTMQNWSDNALTRMPGYRDRISHVPLKRNEGGLNLAMPEALIQKLGERGANSGAEFVRRFAGSEPKMNWDNHRWIRMRSMFASLEKTFNGLATACDYYPPGEKYEDWLNDPDFKAPAYPFRNQKQRVLALETLRKMLVLPPVKLAETETPLEEGAPRPRPELRPRPRI